MERDATIVGTREGFYLGCIDEERAGTDCDEQCPVCQRPCRVLLEKDQPIETGRRVRVEIYELLLQTPRKLIPILMGIYIVTFFIMHILRKAFLQYYRSYWPVILSGIFTAGLFYLILRLREEKKGTGEALRMGKILRVYPREEKARR